MNEALPIVEQVVIAVCGLSGIVLSQAPEIRVRKLGCIVGLCAQPAWLHVAWANGQWGIFLLAIGYSLAWGYGLSVNWTSR